MQNTDYVTYLSPEAFEDLLAYLDEPPRVLPKLAAALANAKERDAEK